MREGEEFAGADGRARVGQFFGLGSRVVCGEDNGGAAGATAVDMAGKRPELNFPRDRNDEIFPPGLRSGA